MRGRTSQIVSGIGFPGTSLASEINYIKNALKN
jgi:hypothetical protein